MWWREKTLCGHLLVTVVNSLWSKQHHKREREKPLLVIKCVHAGKDMSLWTVNNVCPS